MTPAPRVIKIFNAQLAALVDRLRTSLPDNYNIRKGQMALQLAPSNMVFEFWVSTVMPACGAQLLARDLDYFMNMNFDAAMALLRGAALDGQIESAAKEYAGSSGGDYATLFEETIRAPMLKLSDDGRAFCMDILANLSQLAANTMPPAPTVKPVAGYVMPPAPAADEEPEQEKQKQEPEQEKQEQEKQEQEQQKKKKRSDEDDDGNNKRARTSSPPDADAPADAPADADAPAAAPAATLKRVEKDDLEEGAKKKRKPSPEQEEKEV